MEATSPGEPVRRPSTHPEHDVVAQEVRRWYTTSFPEIGQDVSEHWYGYQSNHSPTRSRVILCVDNPDHVRAALDDARSASGISTLTIWVDNRERAARLDAALRHSGCRTGEATTHLALVGRIAKKRTGPDRLVIEDVDETRFEEWATVKLQSFGDTEAAPAPDRLARQVATRRDEMAVADCQLGVLDGQTVAVLASYRGPDRMVFNLGTRVPYRHQGIAQAMLAHWADAGIASGCRP